MTDPRTSASAANWVKVIDQTACIGCHACTTACKSENQVPLGVTRTYVKAVDVGAFPAVRRAFQVTRCNQCADAPCVAACPTAAMYRRADGIVDFDKRICIGCRACMAACPYDAIFINPEDGSAEKCNYCAHRIELDLEPACVIVCPTQAIRVGTAATVLADGPFRVRRPEAGTRPQLFYRGAGPATLDPLAARRPDGGLFMWAEQPRGEHTVNTGHPGAWDHAGAAEAVAAYDVNHHVPWDWKVSAYTWTKSVAAGLYLVMAALCLFGALERTSTLARTAAPLAAGAFLAATAALLVADLEHPERFWMILARPQWRSWLARGGFILAGYALALGVHLAAVAGGGAAPVPVMVAGTPLALASAVYTAWLFAQARGRDLWRSRLLAPHLAVQAVVAGAAVATVLDALLDAGAGGPLGWTLAGAAALHAALVVAEARSGEGSRHRRLAVWEMTAGRYRSWYRAGLALAVAAAVLAPVAGLAGLAGVVAALAALAGLGAYEHAFVQAGQAVPLA